MEAKPLGACFLSEKNDNNVSNNGIAFQNYGTFNFFRLRNPVRCQTVNFGLDFLDSFRLNAMSISSINLREYVCTRKRKRELEKGLDKISTHKSALDAIKNINGIQSKSRQIIQRQGTNHSQQEHK